MSLLNQRKMRKRLKPLNKQRKRFIGSFVRFGQKNGFKGPLPTLLLKNIRDISSGKEVTSHAWFNLTKSFAAINLKENDIVEFDARVKDYVKGYFGRKEEVMWEKPLEIDYKLSHPTKLKIIKLEAKMIKREKIDEEFEKWVEKNKEFGIKTAYENGRPVMIRAMKQKKIIVLPFSYSLTFSDLDKQFNIKPM